MPDTKVKGKKSMLDKWNELVIKWEAYGQSKGIHVKFKFWGSFELTERLLKRENEGLKYFWFNQEEFTDDWFEIKNRESINALGNRYTPEINFDLPIVNVFDGFSRDKNFEKQTHAFFRKTLDKYGNHWNFNQTDEIKLVFKELTDKVNNFKLFYKKLRLIGNEKLPVTNLIKQLNEILDCGKKLKSYFYKLREDEENGKINYYSRPYDNQISDIRSFVSVIDEFLTFINSPAFRLANHPFLVLTGAWGRGKSHLLADIIKRRKEKGEQSLLLLGENFTTKESPWSQILYNQLRRNNIDEFVFLGALNAKAESLQSRIVIFIDALNEGEGRFIWPKRLKSFFEAFENYPWIGLVVSIRDTFVPLIAPENDLDIEKISYIEHQGFEGLEYQASKYFFEYYKIVQPKIPLLYPEFQTPLFLKLFCLSIHNRNLHEIPNGYMGLTMILNDYLESIETKLSRPEELEYDVDKKLVRKSIEKILTKLIENQKDYLKYEEADEIVDSVFNGNCFNPQPFLKKLISEGVFNKNLHWENDMHYHVIYFSYQRFQDHLTISMLLDMHLDINEPEKSFKSGRLWELTKDNGALHFNQNLIEAISIQLPERIQKEFSEVAPHTKLFYSTAYAFIESLIWRKTDSVNDATKEYVNVIVLQNEDLFNKFMDVMISTSMIPGYYFNAERLHNYLNGFSLPDRDKVWTIWLQNKYGENSGMNSVKRLIDWAWNEEDKSHISDDSVMLGATTLSWFFTSANRYLRDSATKALISLLQDRMHLLIPLIKNFSLVNDPYVIERIYAVVYGCVLRSKDIIGLKELSEHIYKEIFNQETVYPNILLRDYARGIIEFSIYKGIKVEIDIEKIRPPYKSELLPIEFPSNAQIDNKYQPKGEAGNYGGEQWGSTALINSMYTLNSRSTSGYGDFGMYVFQSAFRNWEIDSNLLSNYAIQRIFEIGYDPKLFTEFDSKQGSGRGSGHKERIGKKYQWIAFYEILAQVSDQKELLDESNWDRNKKTIKYDGPWYPYIRDIDPTILIRDTKTERYEGFTQYWWFNTEYSNWEIPDKEWVNVNNDLPNPINIIEKADLKNENWIWLEIHPEWSEPLDIDEDKWNSNKKRIWYQIRSYIIRKKDQHKFEKDFSDIFYRRELPEARSLYSIFSREYFWSPAFDFQNKPYYNGEEWIEVYDKKEKRCIGKVLRPVEIFNWEEEYDCSKVSNIAYYKPSKALFDGLNMNYSKKEGELIDQKNELVCFDPSVNTQSISGLLIKKKPLYDFLDSQGLVLIWTVIGEKQILGNNWSKDDYPGQLNISGLISMKNNMLSGKLNTKRE